MVGTKQIFHKQTNKQDSVWFFFAFTNNIYEKISYLGYHLPYWSFISVLAKLSSMSLAVALLVIVSWYFFFLQNWTDAWNWHTGQIWTQIFRSIKGERLWTRPWGCSICLRYRRCVANICSVSCWDSYKQYRVNNGIFCVWYQRTFVLQH